MCGSLTAALLLILLLVVHGRSLYELHEKGRDKLDTFAVAELVLLALLLLDGNLSSEVKISSRMACLSAGNAA